MTFRDGVKKSWLSILRRALDREKNPKEIEKENENRAENAKSAEKGVAMRPLNRNLSPIHPNIEKD